MYNVYWIFILKLYTAVMQSRNTYNISDAEPKSFLKVNIDFHIDSWSEIEFGMTVKFNWTNTYQIQCMLLKYDTFQHRLYEWLSSNTNFAVTSHFILFSFSFFWDKKLIQSCPLGPFYAVFSLTRFKLKIKLFPD